MPRRSRSPSCSRRSFRPAQLRILLEHIIPHANLLPWVAHGGYKKGNENAFRDAFSDANFASKEAGGPDLVYKTLETLIGEMRWWYRSTLCRLIRECNVSEKEVYSVSVSKWPAQLQQALARDVCAPWFTLWHDHVNLRRKFVPPPQAAASAADAGPSAVAPTAAGSLLPPVKPPIAAEKKVIKRSLAASPVVAAQDAELDEDAGASEPATSEEPLSEEPLSEEEYGVIVGGHLPEEDTSGFTHDWVRKQQQAVAPVALPPAGVAATRPLASARPSAARAAAAAPPAAVVPAKRRHAEAEAAPAARPGAPARHSLAVIVPAPAGGTRTSLLLPDSVKDILSYPRLFSLACRIPRGDGGSEMLDQFLEFLSGLHEEGALAPTCSRRRAKKALFRLVELALEVSLDLGSAESDTYELIHELGRESLSAVKELD